MKSVSAQMISCCVFNVPKKYATHDGIIPYMFNCWGDQVVHLLLLKSSMIMVFWMFMTGNEDGYCYRWPVCLLVYAFGLFMTKFYAYSYNFEFNIMSFYHLIGGLIAMQCHVQFNFDPIHLGFDPWQLQILRSKLT